MSTISQPNDYVALYTDLQSRVREQTGVSATKTIAQRFINIALHDIHIGFGERFPWCERQATLNTQAEYTTGTITATQGSASIVGVGTAWNTNSSFGIANMRVGGKIVVNGGNEVYEISTVDSDLTATLNSRFVQADVSAGSYKYFEDEYALSDDFLRPLDLQNFDIRGDIRLTDRKTFREQYPRNSTTGKPRVATIQDKAPSGNTAPVRKVRFWQPPDKVYLLSYAFVTNKLATSAAGMAQTDLVADTDEPIIPLQYRHLLITRALYWLYRDRKDDQRSQAVNAEFTDLMLRVTGDVEIGAKHARFVPAVSGYQRAAQQPYSGGRRSRYSADSRFDQIRD